MPPGQCVHDLKANIMSIARESGSGIAQTHNHFHCNVTLRLQSIPPLENSPMGIAEESE